MTRRRKSKKPETGHGSGFTPTDNSGSFSFLHLPWELRDMIYSHVMCYRYGIQVGSSSKPVSSRHSIKKREVKRPVPGLLGTCHQIRDEMEPLLTKHYFARNTFEFGLCCHDFDLFRDVVKEDAFKAIRSIRLAAFTIVDLMWTFTNFEHLNDLYIGPVTRKPLRDPRRAFERWALLLQRFCHTHREKVDRIWLQADEKDTSMQDAAKKNLGAWDSRDVKWLKMRFFDLEIELNDLLNGKGTR